jgi:putative transposase
VKTVKLPARSPNLNAYAERFVRSIKSECLSHIIPLGERHLRNVINEFTEHYHLERNHQGLNNQLIENNHVQPDLEGTISCHQRLGGVLKYYHRLAA